MAIAIDTTTNTGFTASGTSLTMAHTCTGSNVALIASFWMWNSITVSSCNFDGAAMTLCDTINTDNTGVEQIYGYLVGTGSGTGKNVVMTITTTDQLFGCTGSYTGVSQGTAVSAWPKVTQTGTATTGADTLLPVTTAVDDSWLFCSVRNPSANPDAPASGYGYQRALNTTAGNSCQIFDSNGGTGTAGAKNIEFSVATNGTYYAVAIGFPPSTGSASLVPSMASLGVGA